MLGRGVRVRDAFPGLPDGKGRPGSGGHHPGGEADNKHLGHSSQGRGQLPTFHQVCPKLGMFYRQQLPLLNPREQELGC